jgi:hypothetical protein
MVVAERRRIKGMTWTQERLEKLGSGGFLFRYRRFCQKLDGVLFFLSEGAADAIMHMIKNMEKYAAASCH